MIGRNPFPSTFDAAFADYPSAPLDHVFTAEGAGATCIVIAVKPRNAPPWTAGFAAPEPGRRVLSALLSTPSPTGLCIVERGTAFLGDVLVPERFVVVPTMGPVVSAEQLAVEEKLLLVTPWTITAVGHTGALWTTQRVAIDSVRLDEVSDGWLRGVADPESDEPRDFAVDLGDGDVIGGAGFA